MAPPLTIRSWSGAIGTGRLESAVGSSKEAQLMSRSPMYWVQVFLGVALIILVVVIILLLLGVL
jgi:hypothetical protein